MAYKHIKHIFFDLDNTLWDFSVNSRHILDKMYAEFELKTKGIQHFEAFYQGYHIRNEWLWNSYRLGDKSKEEVRLERFQYTLSDFGINHRLLAMQMADFYIEHTRQVRDLVPGALSLLPYLKNKYTLHIITNGFEEVQLYKLKNTGIRSYFDTITTAEAAGALKPDPVIYQKALSDAACRAGESLYIGDSPEADGIGSIRNGFSFIWFNYHNRENTHNFEQVISHLNELQQLL